MHDEAELEPLQATARQWLAVGPLEPGLGLGGPERSRPLEIASFRMATCWMATRRTEMFRQLVLARIIEATNMHDSLQVLEEAGALASSYPRSTGACRLRRRNAAAGPVGGPRRTRPARPGQPLPIPSVHLLRGRPGNGFREPGVLKEGMPPGPQITISLRTGPDGFPLMVSAFVVNKGRAQDDASTHRAIEPADLSFICVMEGT